MSRLRLGISSCPNDTFVFHGLMSGAVEMAGFELAIELGDIEALNGKLARGELDAAKVSFATALALAADTVVLPAGAALGFGVGPLLLRAPQSRFRVASDGRIAGGARVLCPGAGTTAHLLYRLFHRGEGRVEQVVFSEILPALSDAAADFGVCIHEGRFAYRARGLELVEDLGATWEARTGSPLPLGGIVARRTLPEDALDALTTTICASLAHAEAHRADALVTMRRHAQELDDRVLWAHVDLYVNRWTRDLGPDGCRALAVLGDLARASGLLDPGAPALAIFERGDPGSAR